MKHFYLPKSLVVLTLFFLGSSLFAQSGKVSIQGILKNFNGTVATDGPYDMEFKIYTSPTGGAAIWTETQSGVDAVEVSSGVYNTVLGKTIAGSNTLSALAFDVPYYVGIKVLTGANPLEMTPRIELAYAINSFHAAEANHADTADFATVAYAVQGNISSDTIVTKHIIYQTTTYPVPNGAEILTGELWYDGRPIYRKTILNGVSCIGCGGVFGYVGHGLTMIDFKGYVQNGAGGNMMPLDAGRGLDTDAATYIQYNPNDGNLYGYNWEITNGTAMTWLVIMDYVKP
jgi:hypothetical protein